MLVIRRQPSHVSLGGSDGASFSCLRFSGFTWPWPARCYRLDANPCGVDSASDAAGKGLFLHEAYSNARDIDCKNE